MKAARPGTAGDRVRIRGCGRVEEEVQRRGEGVPACLSRGGHIYKFTTRMTRGSGRFFCESPVDVSSGGSDLRLPPKPSSMFFLPPGHPICFPAI